MLEELFQILNGILPNKVFYGTNEYDNGDNASMPYIVYEEIGKRPIGYHDDLPINYSSTIQITLVTAKKDLNLEHSLESSLLENELVFQVVSEYKNSDKSINRIYEIKMEDI